MTSGPKAADPHERVFEFLETLRLDGYRIGVREHVAARKLLVALSLDGKDGDFAALGPWLAPIVCATRADQEGFAARWEQLLRKEAPDVVVTSPPDKEIVGSWRRSASWAALATLVLGVAAVVVRAKYFEPESVPVPAPASGEPAVNPDPDPAPIDTPLPTEAVPVVRWTREFDQKWTKGSAVSTSFSPTGSVSRQIAFSPDGALLASAEQGGSLRLLDVAERRARGEPLNAPQNGMLCVAFSADGVLLASGGGDGSVRLWTVADGRASGEPLLGHEDRVLSVAFSPDGRLLASGGLDGAIRLWDVVERRERGELVRGDGDVFTVAFSPDGTLLASGGTDGFVHLWGVGEGGERGAPLRHGSTVYAVAFSPDGRLLASAGYDRTVRLWSVAERRARGEPLLGHEATVGTVAFSPEGTLLASGDYSGSIRLWSVTESRAYGEPLSAHQGWVWSVAFSPDGVVLASAGDDGTINLWRDDGDVGSKRPIGSIARSVSEFVFSPGGDRIAVGDADASVYLANPATGAVDLLFSNDDSPANCCIAFSNAGKYIVFAHENAGVRLWDLESNRLAWDDTGLSNGVLALAFSPDDASLATAAVDGRVRLWSGQLFTGEGRVAQEHASAATSVAFSPDGKYLASGSGDGDLVLSNIERGLEREVRLDAGIGSVRSIAFTPDSRAVLCDADDGSVRVWNVGDGSSAGPPLEGHAGAVFHVSVSNDGSRVLTASEDGTAVVWDFEDRSPIDAIRVRSKPGPFPAAFDADGRQLVTADEKGNIWLWDLPDHRDRPIAWILAAAVAALATWMLLRHWFRSWSLRSGTVKTGDRVTNVVLDVEAPITHEVLSARRLAVQLRRPTLVGSADIDAERTIERTVANGGFLQIVRRGRPQTPEYLALVERVAPRDHLARNVDDRLERLRAEGLHVERMSFLGDPRVVYASEGRGRFVTLGDVHARHPDHRVWTIGESGLASSAAATDPEWLEDLAAWPHRAFVVPDPADAGPDVAYSLAQAGIRIGAIDDPVATLEDLGRPGPPPRERSIPFPPSLRRDRELWTSPTAPEPHRVRLMLEEVRRYLGPDLYRWFAACSVYPELRYELTLQIARLVLPDRAMRDEDVVRISRLPWFRRGLMPEWLRRQLLRELPHEDERRLRDWFARVFTHGARVAEPTARRDESQRALLELPIAQEARAAVQEEFRGVAKGSSRDDSADPALKDAVFLSWMDDRLAIAVPRALVSALRGRAGSDALLAEPRPLWRAVAAAFGGAFLLEWATGPLGEPAGVRVGVFAVAVYALLIAAARRPSGVRFPRAALLLEMACVFFGIVVADTIQGGKEPSDSHIVSVFYGIPVLAWAVFEALAFRARRRSGTTGLERVARTLVLDEIVAWLVRDHSGGARTEPVASRAVWWGLVTPVVAGLVVAAAWRVERASFPNEWAWSIVGLVLVAHVVASAFAQPKRGSRFWWIASAAETAAAWAVVLLVSAETSGEIAWAGSLWIPALSTAGIALAVAGVAALQRRQHPLYAASTPLLAVCDALSVERWLFVLWSKVRESRRAAAAEVSA